MKYTLLFIAVFSMYPFSISYGDDFRISKMHSYVLNTQHVEPISAAIGYNDALSLQLPSSSLFIEGVEFEIKQPKESLNFPNAIAYTIYRNVSPAPDAAIIDYSAEKIFSAILPNRSGTLVLLPLKADHTLKKNPYTVLIPHQDENTATPLVLRLNPVVKGLPEDIEQALFKITIRPVLLPEGGLRLSLQHPEAVEKPVSIQINQNPVTDLEEIHLLLPGTHTIHITSNDYRTEMRSFVIERGKITNLSVSLQPIIPLLRINAPNYVTILLDGQEMELSNTFRPVTAGVHVVIFKIGEYELTRQIVAEEGKKYELSLDMDVILQEVE